MAAQYGSPDTETFQEFEDLLQHKDFDELLIVLCGPIRDHPGICVEAFKTCHVMSALPLVTTAASATDIFETARECKFGRVAAMFAPLQYSECSELLRQRLGEG